MSIELWEVYAQFPRAVTIGAELDISPSNWRWIHCLTLPLQTLIAIQISQKPYKWIRYAIGVVVGAEGDLSLRPDVLDAVDYNASLPTESTTLYYHINDEERRRMSPADPNNVRTMTDITSSVATVRRFQFHKEVAERDGDACVLTNANPDYCDAVHLLPHSKGDAYITTYTQRRSRDPTGTDIVQDINSIRNGLFLNALTHRALGTNIAFLMTPNFAMTTSDINPTAPPTQTRCTAHAFTPGDPFALGTPSLKSGTPIRISASPEWPPAIIFDAVYASSVLHHFGSQTLKDETLSTGGVVAAAQAGGKEIAGESAGATVRCNGRKGPECGPDPLDMLMTLPYILMTREERLGVTRAAQEKAQAAEQTRVREKVETWMKQVDPPEQDPGI
ncbi:hypothetical protein FA15DRAFT_689918 [Coprinopsis marcescibilis]|uniref:HNH nuclease domain-containing protein n=1 Tax=Coprinopsis marcescibilis TaxID=230819 RepID=A0A5C3KCP2_COPMA|nr:hypothetical protein FA15DRAFT_689918 [Coprinopsis marcescibilis]